jgi:hypothetical protein
MSRLEELGSEVSSSLEQARTHGDATARVRAKLVARQVPRLRAEWREQRASANFRFAVVATLAVAATIALTAFFAWPRHQPRAAAVSPVRKDESSKLSFVVGEGASEERGATGTFIAAPLAKETPVTFSDGSRLRLAPAARVRVAEVAREGARVLVESGAVHVSVVHKDETRWAVEAGPFEVRVTGTKFDVVYDPASTGLVVRMTEGSVFVRGCGLLGDDGRRLSAGEKLTVSCKDKAMSVSSADDPSALPPAAASEAPGRESLANPMGSPTESSTKGSISTTAPAVPNTPGSAAATVNHANTNAPHDVIALARRGAHTEALMSAEANGFAATCDALSGPDLLLLADAARYAGRFDRASEALEITRRRFAGSDAAATAAFELGRIAMDIRRDLTASGDQFETYLRERPSGSLAREALGRAIEARHRSGDNARAERLAVRYLAAYPDGPHAKLARKLTSTDVDSRTP